MTHQQELQRARMKDVHKVLIQRPGYCEALVEMLRLAGLEAPPKPTKTQAAIYTKRIFSMIPLMNGEKLPLGDIAASH